MSTIWGKIGTTSTSMFTSVIEANQMGGTLGRLNIFYKGVNGNLWHMGPSFSPAINEDLGDSIAGIPHGCSFFPDQLDVIASNANGFLLHKIKSWESNQWQQIQLISNDVITDYSIVTSNIKLSDGKNCRLDAVGKNAKGNLAHNYWDGQWHDWTDLGDAAFGRITSIVNPLGGFEVLYQGPSNSNDLMCKSYNPTTGWSKAVRARQGGVDSFISAFYDQNNTLFAYYRTTSGYLVFNYRKTSGAWSNFIGLGATQISGPPLAMILNGTIYTFALGTDLLMRAWINNLEPPVIMDANMKFYNMPMGNVDPRTNMLYVFNTDEKGDMYGTHLMKNAWLPFPV